MSAYAAVGFLLGKMALAWLVITPQNVGLRQAVVDEKRVESGSFEEETMSHAGAEDQSDPPNSSENDVESGGLWSVQTNCIGSTDIWAEKEDEAADGEFRSVFFTLGHDDLDESQYIIDK